MTAFMEELQHLKIQLEDINLATDNFGEKAIGNGGFGKVYKGELKRSKGKSMVALKRLDRKYGQGDREFFKEIDVLSRYSHENIISLLGFCNEGDEMILVYEYASRGSLDRHLSDSSLSWKQRLSICLAAAKGLSYLHDPSGAHQRIIHCDIKSSNILLDENWNAKVSDFGLSKIGPANQQHSFLITNVEGTPGYCDPLYMETYTLTKESDIYSFGVVLFEVLCGRLCFELIDRRRSQILVPMWKQKYEEEKLDEIIFEDLKQQMDPSSLKSFTDIAYQCLQKSREKRPTMARVLEKLQIALEYHELYEEKKQPRPYENMIKTEVSISGSTHAQNVYSPDDFPKTVARTLNQGSKVTCMDFHPQQQNTLLVGTNVGEISIWEVGSREKMVHKPFQVWDISVCSVPFQTTLVEDAAVSVNRCIWGPDGSKLGVAFSKHIVQMYIYTKSRELWHHLEIDAHMGGVNDIAFANPNGKPGIITCGDDKIIMVWDAETGRKCYMFQGHEAPVYSVCIYYNYIFSTAIDGKIKAWLYASLGSRGDIDAPGLCRTTMAYSADGNRLFSCGTSEEGDTYLTEWDESTKTIKRKYSGFRKSSMGIVQFDTTRNRFLAAGDEFQIKFWDMDSKSMLTATDADDELPERPQLRFNKEGSLLAITTSDNRIKILANGDGQRMLHTDATECRVL